MTQQQAGFPQIPARPASGGPTGLPQRPTDAPMPGGDDIDNLIRMAEAGIRPAVSQTADEGAAAGGKAAKKEKDKKGKMVYDDAEFSPEERMAALPRYAYAPA